MLRTGALHFTRTDKLEAFDRFEGSLPSQNYRSLTPALRSSIEDLRAHRLVNCWHAREHETHGLWQSYVPTGEGLAIRTSIDRLQGALRVTLHPVYAGLVMYIDYDTTVLPDDVLNFLYLYKRLYFEDEREFRLVIGTEGMASSGLRVEVDLDVLIADVVVPPTASQWFTHEVALLFEHYGYPRIVRQSEIARDPSFYKSEPTEWGRG